MAPGGQAGCRWDPGQPRRMFTRRLFSGLFCDFGNPPIRSRQFFLGRLADLLAFKRCESLSDLQDAAETRKCAGQIPILSLEIAEPLGGQHDIPLGGCVPCVHLRDGGIVRQGFAVSGDCARAVRPTQELVA